VFLKMTETVLDLLMNGSPMVAFAGYFLWSNHRSERKIESQHTEFLTKLDTLEDRHAKIQEQTRERWMQVVEKLEQEKSQALGQLNTQHERILIILDNLKGRTEP